MDEIQDMNSGVTCPVCNMTYKSKFALDGHLRLTMDANHIAFRQQQNKTESNTSGHIIPMIPYFAGYKLINVLENFVNEQERIYGEEAKTNKYINNLKEMIHKEREDEKKETHDKIEAELMQQYDKDVETAVAQIKAELKQDHEKEIKDYCMKAVLKGFCIGFGKAVICIPNPSNDQYLIVQQNSPLHKYIMDLVNNEWMIHPKKCRLIFEEHAKFLIENPIKINEQVIIN